MRRKERAPNEIVGEGRSSFQSCDLPKLGWEGQSCQASQPDPWALGDSFSCLRGKTGRQTTALLHHHDYHHPSTLTQVLDYQVIRRCSIPLLIFVSFL